MAKKSTSTKKKESDAGRNLQNPKTPTKKKREAAEILGKIPNKKK